MFTFHDFLAPQQAQLLLLQQVLLDLVMAGTLEDSQQDYY